MVQGVETSMAPPREIEPLAAGTLIDHFQVQRLIGRGGMGDVYCARDVRLGRKVALKLVSPEKAGALEVIERIRAEARTIARFSHPHIVAIHFVGEYRNAPYLALEYLEGENLFQRLRKQRPSIKEAARIGMAIAQAVAEAHRHHTLHRDLKPQNVLLPPDGRLRVVDFGIAKLCEPAAAHERPTGTGNASTSLWGTPATWRRSSGAGSISALPSMRGRSASSSSSRLRAATPITVAARRSFGGR